MNKTMQKITLDLKARMLCWAHQKTGLHSAFAMKERVLRSLKRLLALANK
jgi:hypothetical protein